MALVSSNGGHGGSGRRTCLGIVLAAGEGKRMRSAQPKALHRIAGLSMLGHVLSALLKAGADRIVVVVGPDHDALVGEARKIAPGVEAAVQAERRGTAHAVLAARTTIAEGFDDILIAFADTPLLRPETFAALRAALADRGGAVVAAGFEARNPAGYGRLIVENGQLEAIREDRDASATERRLTLCNAGIMALAGGGALDLLDAVGCDNSRREFYLTDVVGIARARKLGALASTVPEEEVLGVNDRAQLAAAEALQQGRLREAAMRAGATLIDPSSVAFSFDTVIAEDVTIEPFVVFGPGVTVGRGSLIRSFSYLEQARVGENASVGPFARLRPGAALMRDVHIGNFVEIKGSTIGPGAKINHLSYIGDAEVGAATNIGAGTITCNYDGFGKFRTEIGAGVFVGSHSSFVAPVKIGDGAYIGTGSVITHDVAPDSLALARQRQVEKPGWAASFRARRKT